MDNELKTLLDEYDKADFYYYMATEDDNETYRFTEVDVKNLLKEREEIFAKLEAYGVKRDESGELYGY